MGNPLVAETKDSTTAYSGISLLESANDLKSAIESGDWASVAMGAVGTALDALSMAMDPFGAILAAGVGWLMEHVGPLKEALDGLTGNADEIAAQSETWKNIATELGSIGEDLTGMVKTDTASWTGPAADTYRQRAQDTVTLLETARKGCEGASSGVKTAGEVVAAVRALVRDIIAELIGHLISWALQVVFTLGIGLTWVVPQVIGAVAKTASKIADLTKRLVKALQALIPLLKKAGSLFGDAAKALRNIKPGKAAPPPKHADINGNPKGPDGPKGDGTTPSGANGDGTTPSGAEDGPGRGPKNDPPPASKGPDDTSSSNGATTTTGAGRGPGAEGSGGGKGGGKPRDRGLSDHNQTPKENSTPAGCRPGSGDPIDMTTGRMMLAQTDVEIEGVLSLLLERAHFSGYRTGVHFGRSWASTADQRLETTAGRVDFAAEDGTLLVYPVPGAAAVAPVEGPLWPLRRLGDEYVMEQPDLGRVLHFPAGGDIGWLSAISDADGNRIVFDRDAHGTLREVRHSAGHRVAVTTVDGRITELASVGERDDDRVTLARFAYDERANLVEVVNSSGRPYRFTCDDAGRITGWQDRNGWGYEFTYDERGRCVRGTGPRGVLSYTFAYDRENRVNRATDSLGHTTTYELNEDFQLVRETDPLGGVTAYEWDRHDRLLAVTDPLGRVTRYGYDEHGRRTSETRPDGSVRSVRYDRRGRPQATVEPDGAVWAYEYDDAGRLVATTDPAGGVRRYGYGPGGALSSFTDEEGRTTGIECDALGKPRTVLDPAGGRTSYTYDRLGRVESVTDPAGHTTKFAWTVEGELWKRIAPDGSVERFTYDGEVNAIERTDAAGAVTRTDFGPFDLPVCEIAPDGSRTRFGYDTELRLVSVTNAAGAQWRIDYDAAGRVVRETDFDGRVVTYRRDAAGQLVESATGAGEPTTYTYDTLGRLTGKRRGNSVTTYAYDAADRLVRATNADADLTLTYDRLGRVAAETCNGREVRSGYDRSGLRTVRRTASGVTSTWTYDAASAPAELSTAGRSIRFAYDAAGREIGRVFGAAALAQTWDANDRLLEQVVTGPDGRPRQRRAYRHRADDVLAGVDDLLSGRREFTLDRLGRVIGLQRPGGSERYAYDALGNIAVAEWSAHPAAGPREYTGTLVRRAGEVRYRYDDLGRLTWRQQPGGPAGWSFGWNADDRLEQVRTPDGREWRYAYDALGRRIAKRLLGPDGTVAAETVFVWDGIVPAEEIVTAAGAPARVTTWDWEPDRPVPVSVLDRRARADGGVDEQFHAVVADLIGSPAELVDESGQVAWHSAQTLWGVQTAGAAPTPLRFPGQYYDAETGLHYNVNRYYEPETGRYISPDPIGLGGGTNPHAYVRNPTGWLDPVGLKGRKGKCKGGKSNNPVLANNRPGQPVFHGNANVPVQEINDKRFVGLLEKLAGQKGEAGRRAKELLKQMREGRGWQQTAGIHQGGLGGAAGGADPRPHITVNVGGRGYHVHVGKFNGQLFAQDITPNPIR
ncbi:RHS repeat-associated core domain-containing protein [Amycolatopsis australiensis]|uniref:RHS repeat-associated core domain-containing protein n=1 Tax=Amycolatopsis australiensis TaxID=546364 RepID=A0A1K1SWP3_9PSEU|nr:RHS repeat-associated core domain-containing protein [Amycolatopsis australiensis]SFW88769.1 RHS repeat-associated core domain-containing protein [Amycolatopsis australiensis]